VRLAGIAIPDQDVLQLALLLRKAGFDETAERLEDACDVETKILALTIASAIRSSERSTIRPRGWPSSAVYSCESTSGACGRGSCS